MTHEFEVLMSSTAEKSLVSIAMLKVRYDLRHQDYLDYLRPFVAHVLPGVGERVRSDSLTTSLLEQFGLNIPIQVVERLLYRFEKQKFLKRLDGSLFVDAAQTDESFAERRRDAEDNITSVVREFRGHCLGRFEIDISEDDAVVSLTGFVRRFAVECLRSFLLSSPIPNVPSTVTTDVWAASFINDAAEKAGQVWDEVRTLFQGVLLANAFTCPDADLSTAKFRDVYFYLDTPLLLSALGFHGGYESQKACELVKQIKQLGGSSLVFEHTVEEAQSVLKFAEVHLNDEDASNRVIRTFRESRKSKSDIVLASAQIESLMKGIGIRVKPTPRYDERYQINEVELQGCLDLDIGHVNPKAVLYDVNSIRSIYVLRSGLCPSKLEQAKAIFVSPNSKLAKAADAYSRKFDFSREVSPVITDFALANLCWLKQPAAAQNLANMELLASCVAALRPTDGDWKECLAECDKLRASGKISSDQELLLRESLDTQSDFITLTVGSGVDFGPAVVLELVRRAEERVAKPYAIEAELARDKQQKVTSQFSAYQDAIGVRIDRISTAIAYFCEFLIVVLLAFGSCASLYAAFRGESLESLPSFYVLVVISVALFFSTIGWLGYSRRTFHDWVRPRIGFRIRRILGVP